MGKETLEDKFIGSLLGTFVGDALGMRVERFERRNILGRTPTGRIEEMYARDDLEAGCYTDDTQMMIALAESLIENKGFSGEDMARRFVENFEYKRRYGLGTKRAIENLKKGMPWQEAGRDIFSEDFYYFVIAAKSKKALEELKSQKKGSYGNGSAMRVAPVGLLYYNKPEELRKVAELSSLITHAHLLGKEAAVLQAYAVALAIKLDPEQGFDVFSFLDKLKRFLFPEAKIFQEKLEAIRKLLKEKPNEDKVIEILGNDSRSFQSVPTAIYSFLANKDSFKEAVIYVVNLGGDADTIGAMTGAIAGAFHGYEKIPEEWLASLDNAGKGRNYVIALGKKLFGLVC